MTGCLLGHVTSISNIGFIFSELLHKHSISTSMYWTCISSRIFYRPTNSTFLLHVILNLLGWRLGGVGWGMSTFVCTCVMKLMLRHAWGWGWVVWGGACQRSFALASWSWCYVTHGAGVGWCGVGHVNVRLHLRHEVDATSRMGLGLGGVGHVNVRLHLRHEVDATSRMGLGLGGVGWAMLTFACTTDT